ncbi:hypothetical protein [Glycomyces sp. YM15]|uniref:hypothetical protein n=1 Tax=Glycomyces sp. YM15 TaxID=2800446 RepID=UPI001963BFA8|nr:hypothetical protein [Glycomyces sp. YM15]
MKISELVAGLEEFATEHGDVEVVLSADSEGNRHSPAKGIGDGWYVAGTGWSGGHLVDPDAPVKDPRAVPVAVVWPTH